MKICLDAWHALGLLLFPSPIGHIIRKALSMGGGEIKNMSNVDNSKKVIKLLADSGKFVETVVSNGKAGIASDIAPAVVLLEEVVADLGSFSLALAELKALDEQGIVDLAAELATDLTFASAKVEAIIKAVIAFLPPTFELLAALKMDSAAVAAPAAPASV